jgi:hypothetical protein
VNPDVLAVAQQLADEMSAMRAVATVLMGSYARGTAHSESDVDLTFIGTDEEGWLERRGNHLVSVSWHSTERVIRGFDNPEIAGLIVPAWRNAFLVSDPQGIGAGLKQQAESWRWDRISRRCDLWVAKQVVGYAEEVHRLIGCLERGNLLMAAVVRSVLADRLAMVLAVHLRIFYQSENELWDLVSRAMGQPAEGVQARALGTGDESFRTTCEASLQLYVLAAEQTMHLMSEVQRQVVEYACALAKRGMRIRELSAG